LHYRGSAGAEENDKAHRLFGWPQLIIIIIIIIITVGSSKFSVGQAGGKRVVQAISG
jgi:hypothetical protein